MTTVQIHELESAHKPRDDNFQINQRNDHLVRRIADRFAITIDHAQVIVFLAGLGCEEARR